MKEDYMSHHASHLVLKEAILQCFVARVASCTLEQQLVLLQKTVGMINNVMLKARKTGDNKVQRGETGHELHSQGRSPPRL